MQTEQILAQIEEAKIIEQQTGVLRQAVLNRARLDERRLSEPELSEIIEFVGAYIEHAPALMRFIEEAAALTDAQREVQPMLDATEAYFLAPDDVIPDHYGLVGLLDDAYLTHTLMQAISDRYESKNGERLLPPEAYEINAFIRRLIGEPFVSMLDERVAATLTGPSLQEHIQRMLIVLGDMDLSSGRDPIWQHARAADLAGTSAMVRAY